MRYGECEEKSEVKTECYDEHIEMYDVKIENKRREKFNDTIRMDEECWG